MSSRTELEQLLEHNLKKARDIADAADKESREFTPDEVTNMKAALEEAKSLKDRLKPFEETDSLKGILSEFGPAKAETDGNATKGISADTVVANAKESLGLQFVNSKEFRGWLKEIAPSGYVPESTKGIRSPALHFPGLKALITGASATSAGALVRPDWRGLLDGGTFQRELRLREVVSSGSTDSDTIEYAREGTHTNAAAPVAEATATTGTSGTKPESTFVLSEETENVRTIAHWIPATKRALSDAAQIRTLVDNFLDYGLEEEVEDQMITGDGTGQNFTGLANVSGIQTHAKGADSRVDAARKARTKVRTVGRARANAYLMHPNDWEEFDLAVDNEQRYYFGGPAQLGVPMLWGLPVVESEAVTEGEPWVADFRLAVLYDRERATITVSDSHSDFFIRNMVAILAELRAAFVVLRPAAFVKMTGM